MSEDWIAGLDGRNEGRRLAAERREQPFTVRIWRGLFGWIAHVIRILLGRNWLG